MLQEAMRRWGGWKMDGWVKAFILASLGSLLAGAAAGLTMAIHDAVAPETGNWTWLLMPSHTHLMLIGWVSMMIFGVGYHMIPRFSGALVWSPRMAWWHFWFSLAGLTGMALGFWLNRLQEGRWGWLVGTAGTVQTTAFILFVVNMVVTLWKAGAPRPAEVPSGLRPLSERLAVRQAQGPASAAVPGRSGRITADDVPGKLLEAHPELLEVFLRFGFQGLANEEHRRTMAMRITVAQAAARHQVDLDALLTALNERLKA